MRITGKGTPAFLITTASVHRVLLMGRIQWEGEERLLIKDLKKVGEFHKRKKTKEEG